MSLAPQPLAFLVQLVPLQVLGLASPLLLAHWLARSGWQLGIQAGESAGLACSCSSSWTPVQIQLKDHAYAGRLAKLWHLWTLFHPLVGAAA